MKIKNLVQKSDKSVTFTIGTDAFELFLSSENRPILIENGRSYLTTENPTKQAQIEEEKQVLENLANRS